MTVIVQRRINLEPKFLDQNIEQHLLSKIVESTVNECSKKNGYILSVNCIQSFDNIEDTVFLVKFEAETFKPTIGDEVTGKVFMIFKDGVFVNIADKQKMLIPAMTMKSFKFDSVNNIYTNEEGLTIQEGDEIQTKISAVKYTKGGFSCCGCLV